jgi:hypothetical protein
MPRQVFRSRVWNDLDVERHLVGRAGQAVVDAGETGHEGVVSKTLHALRA